MHCNFGTFQIFQNYFQPLFPSLSVNRSHLAGNKLLSIILFCLLMIVALDKIFHCVKRNHIPLTIKLFNLMTDSIKPISISPWLWLVEVSHSYAKPCYNTHGSCHLMINHDSYWKGYPFIWRKLVEKAQFLK